MSNTFDFGLNRIEINFSDYLDLIQSKQTLEKTVQQQRDTIANLMTEKGRESCRYSSASEKLIRTYDRMKAYQDKLNRIGQCNLNLYNEAKALGVENAKLREALEKIAKYDAQHVAITALRGAA